MEVTLERGEGEVPPLDGLAEFKVLTSAAPAEFNQPSQVVVVSKGGANQIHGMLLEFNRVAATAPRAISQARCQSQNTFAMSLAATFPAPSSSPNSMTAGIAPSSFSTMKGFV